MLFGLKTLKIGQGFPQWDLVPHSPTQVSLWSLVSFNLTLQLLDSVYLNGIFCGVRYVHAFFSLRI